MRLKRTVTIPASEREEEYSCACDLCGRQVPVYSGEADWATERFSLDDATLMVKVRRTAGSNLSGGAKPKQWSVDICPDCFRTKLVPWLVSQGATVREEDFNW